jgi:hypothetical protein
MVYTFSQNFNKLLYWPHANWKHGVISSIIEYTQLLNMELLTLSLKKVTFVNFE